MAKKPESKPGVPVPMKDRLAQQIILRSQQAARNAVKEDLEEQVKVAICDALEKIPQNIIQNEVNVDTLAKALGAQIEKLMAPVVKRMAAPIEVRLNGKIPTPPPAKVTLQKGAIPAPAIENTMDMEPIAAAFREGLKDLAEAISKRPVVIERVEVVAPERKPVMVKFEKDGQGRITGAILR